MKDSRSIHLLIKLLIERQINSHIAKMSEDPVGLRQVPLLCSGHSRPVPHLCYSPQTVDGVFILSACLDSKAILRNADNGDWIGTFEGHKGAVWGASLDAKALRAATGSADFSAKLWNAATGAELQTYKHKHIVKSVCLTHDASHMLTGGLEKVVRLFDVNSVDPLTTFQGHTESIRHVLWKDENMFLSASSEKELRVWDKRNATHTAVCSTSSAIVGFELSWDGRFIITSGGREINFFDTNSLEKVKTLSVNFEVETASLHPSGKRIVAGGTDMHARVIDFDTNNVLELNKGHHGPIHSIRYHPTGASYASGSEDGTIRIWQSDVAMAIEKQKAEAALQTQLKASHGSCLEKRLVIIGDLADSCDSILPKAAWALNKDKPASDAKRRRILVE